MGAENHLPGKLDFRPSEIYLMAAAHRSAPPRSVGIRSPLRGSEEKWQAAFEMKTVGKKVRRDLAQQTPNSWTWRVSNSPRISGHWAPLHLPPQRAETPRRRPRRLQQPGCHRKSSARREDVAAG